MVVGVGKLEVESRVLFTSKRRDSLLKADLLAERSLVIPGDIRGQILLRLHAGSELAINEYALNPRIWLHLWCLVDPET